MLELPLVLGLIEVTQGLRDQAVISERPPQAAGMLRFGRLPIAESTSTARWSKRWSPKSTDIISSAAHVEITIVTPLTL